MKSFNRTLSFLLVISAATGAQATRVLPLQAGTYIQGAADMSCADAANAGTLYFDGHNIQGPHSSNCTTSVGKISSRGKVFATVSLCDETDKDGKPMQQRVERAISVTDATHFQQLLAGAGARGFHRCGAYPTH